MFTAINKKNILIILVEDIFLLYIPISWEISFSTFIRINLLLVFIFSLFFEVEIGTSSNNIIKISHPVPKKNVDGSNIENILFIMTMKMFF